MKIGFFGGSFNPPTNAHINLAKKVVRNCSLDKVIFVPMSDFYVKEGLAKAEDRLNMLKIVCNEHQELDISDLEVKLNKKMDTIDAFRLIEKNFQNVERFFIMGADNFIQILNWKESQELISKYKYIILKRANIDIEKFINENLKEYRKNIQIIENNEYKEDSSTKFRRDKSASEQIVPKEVFRYIEENKIY